MENKRDRVSEIEREENMIKLQEKITAPLHWTSSESCQIIDLKEQHYQQVLQLIKHSFFSEDPMCSSAKLLEDPISTQAYLDQIRSWMKETQSIVAISRKSGRVVGAAILRINSVEDKSNAYSRIQILDGNVLAKLMDLKNILIKQADIFKQLNESKVLRVYILCVHQSYKSRGLYNNLLEACIEVAIAMEIGGLVGMFTSGTNQQLASTVGFNILSEINYARWKVDNQIVFNNPGIGNYSAAIMGMSTPTTEYMDNIRKQRKLKIQEERVRRKKYQRLSK